MNRTRAMKLFAVVALASAPAVASANVNAKTVARAKLTPRTLATGSPACGNVDSKPTTYVDPACAAATATTTPTVVSPVVTIATRTPAAAPKRALQSVVTAPAARLRPRTLDNGRPACGNLGGKMPASACDPSSRK